MLCLGLLLQAFLPIMEPEPDLCGTPVSPVPSSPRASAGDLDCLIKALLPFQSRIWISPNQAQMNRQILHCLIYNLVIRRSQNALSMHFLFCRWNTAHIGEPLALSRSSGWCSSGFSNAGLLALHVEFWVLSDTKHKGNRWRICTHLLTHLSPSLEQFFQQ